MNVTPRLTGGANIYNTSSSSHGAYSMAYVQGANQVAFSTPTVRTTDSPTCLFRVPNACKPCNPHGASVSSIYRAKQRSSEGVVAAAG